MKYEELLKDPVKRVKELFDYSGIPYKEQTEYFIYESQNKTVDDPYSVFRNKNEKREKRQLPENITEQIRNDLINFEEARRYGYA